MALARALAPQPRVLLLDEPLSALDAKIRVSLRAEMREIQQKLGITTIFVTHDQEEALSISDRVVVMHGGIADQIGTPFQVYNQPRTRFVANFVGTLNTLEAQVSDPAQGVVAIEGRALRIGRPLHGAAVGLALRPEAVHLGHGAEGDMVLPATVTGVHFMGSVIRVQATGRDGPSRWTPSTVPTRRPRPSAPRSISASTRAIWSCCRTRCDDTAGPRPGAAGIRSCVARGGGD